ncbi:hypothetical protein EYR41_011590 [Orbilia oligospora]|uniref:Uncharacterized protein n=1 Tax=Orbilia oligospora TaxID=2813651 RepID=A0A7C8K1Z9_ORBOL|nr:hypothetical protein TWF751_000624 [Orbilia oligospora]TGJ63695.1 hypothetical protein EYR41_011590 [Orbilia oligospora]
MPATLKPPQPLSRGWPSFWRSTWYNWKMVFDNPLGEVAGSLGDLGTLLPLVTAMAAAGTIDPAATFIFSGLWNIVSGSLFGIPIVVQPMKAIASISIARPMTLHETMGAGISVAVIVYILTFTGFLAEFGERIPIPLIKGIQMGAGLSLVLNAGATLMKLSWSAHSADNYIVVVLAWILLCFTSRHHQFPYALLIFGLGMFLVLSTGVEVPKAGWNLPTWTPPAWADVMNGFWFAGLGQLPLTILNSVVAVTYLSADLLPERPSPSIEALGTSVATMNLIGCWFGAMPVCHGSGGLSGQYRFGARSGAAPVMLGIVKVLVGLFFGSSVSTLLANFPKSFLVVLVFAAGIELAKVGEDLNSTARDLWEIQVENRAIIHPTLGLRLHRERLVRVDITDREKKERFVIMLATAGGVIAARNDAVGLFAGTVCYLGYILQETLEDTSFTRLIFSTWKKTTAWLFRHAFGIKKRQPAPVVTSPPIRSRESSRTPLLRERRSFSPRAIARSLSPRRSRSPRISVPSTPNRAPSPPPRSLSPRRSPSPRRSWSPRRSLSPRPSADVTPIQSPVGSSSATGILRRPRSRGRSRSPRPEDQV